MSTKTRRRLPQDVDGNNGKRARWALPAIEAFMRETGVDPEDAIPDLIANLHHLCDRQSKKFGTFEDALRRAEGHYLAETGKAPF